MDEVNSIIKMLDAQNASTATAAQQKQLLETMSSRLQHLKQQVSCCLCTDIKLATDSDINRYAMLTAG